MPFTDEFDKEIYFYRIIMNINGVCSLLSSILAAYIILCKSTPEMANYKWYLINILIWSVSLDTYLGFLYVPQILTPAMGISTQGWLDRYDHIVSKQVQYVSFNRSIE